MDAPSYHSEAPVQVLRDKHGVIIGRLEHQRLTRKTIARDAHGVIVGRYDEREHITREASGRIVARGNVLAALLFRS